MRGQFLPERYPQPATGRPLLVYSLHAYGWRVRRCAEFHLYFCFNCDLLVKSPLRESKTIQT